MKRSNAEPRRPAKTPARSFACLPFLLAALIAAFPCLAREAAEARDDEFGLARLVERDTAAAPAGETLGEEPISLVTGDWIDVREILKTVAASAGLGLQIAPDVEGLVNVHLENVSLETALRSILEPIDLGYEQVGGILMVYKRGMITRWFDFDYMVTERRGRGELLISGRSQNMVDGGGAGGSEQNESHVTSEVEMVIWPELIAAVKNLVFSGNKTTGGSEGTQSHSYSDEEGRSLVVSPMAGLIQATAEWKRLAQVEKYLARMQEALRRQVAIEVKILEVTLSKEHRSGIDWSILHDGKDYDTAGALESTEGLGAPYFQFVVNGPEVSALIEAVEGQGTVKVLSTPRITTLNNQKAVVRIVTEEIFYEAQVEAPVVTNGVVVESVIAYTPTVLPVGLVLDVVPQIGGDRIITLNVHPTITDILRVETSPNQDQSPVISVRELDTVGKVLDGETLVIAGLLSESLHDTEQGVPFLKSVPILGYFFKRKIKEEVQTELVMLLTPVILDADRNAAWVKEATSSIESKM